MNGANQVRVNDLARELQVRAKEIIDLLPEFGVTEKKTHSSDIPADAAEKVRKRINPSANAAVDPETTAPAGPGAKPEPTASSEEGTPQPPVATPPEARGKTATPPAAAAATEPPEQRMSDSCVCDGVNQNCRYCGGSGIMEHRLGPAFDDYSLRRRAIEETRAKASPRPSWWFPSYSSAPLPPETKCPKGCGRWVESQKVQSHLANCTGVRVAPAQKSEPTSSRIANEAGAGQVTSDKDPTRQDTTLVAARDKNLDASKLYAHAYREHGKYGSHPSHDGFGDESSPD